MLTAESKIALAMPNKDTLGSAGEKGQEGKADQTQGQIDLGSLSKLTGFPVDFIKKELALVNDEIPLEDLRKSMLAFLDSTFEELKVR